MAPADMKQAISEYQDFNGLTVTGKLDPETMAKIRSPRCGVADFVGVRKNAHLVRRRKRYALAGQKWPNKALTYRIMNFTPDLSQAQVREAVKKAFQTWSDHTPLTFREITRGSPDINIQFARGEHGDGYPFDGRGGTLAHAYFPGRGIGGDAHFDDHEAFSHRSSRGTDLFLVAAHELGHSLGLAHSSNSRALMAPYYQGYKPNFRLPLDDVKGIQRLYGKKPTPPQQPPSNPNNPPNQPPQRPNTPNQPPQRPNTPNTPNRPNNPNSPPKGPNACGGVIDAAMNFDGMIFLFQKDQYWVLEEQGRVARGYPKKIATYWKKAPASIDAAFVMQTTENVVFFKGNKWFEFQGRRLIRQGALSQLGFPATVQKIDAAVVWEGNSMPYLFTGNDYYRLNEERGRVDRGYPKPITPNWVNIPGNVNAAFGNQGFTYFLKGTSYYKFDDNAIRRVGGARDFGANFMGCTGGKNFRYDSSAEQSRAKLATILLPILLSLFYLFI